MSSIPDDLIVSISLDTRALTPIRSNVLVRVVQTCRACPSQWDAWTTTGQYLYLRYRQGIGSVEQQPGPDVDTWEEAGDTLICEWDDGTGMSGISLEDFLAAAGLELAPDAELENEHYG